MFFNKNLKKAFVFPTKTGTITTRIFLGEIGWHGKLPYHEFPNDLIGEYPALNEYKLYGFFRDPIKRFESCILHIKQIPPQDKFLHFLKANLPNKGIEDVSYDELVDVFDLLKNEYSLGLSKQVSWLDHPKVTALDFENFESELRRVTEDYVTPIVIKNVSSNFGRSVITDKVRAFVRDYYADDYNFAKQVLNKDY